MQKYIVLQLMYKVDGRDTFHFAILRTVFAQSEDEAVGKFVKATQDEKSDYVKFIPEACLSHTLPKIN